VEWLARVLVELDEEGGIELRFKDITPLLFDSEGSLSLEIHTRISLLLTSDMALVAASVGLREVPLPVAQWGLSQLLAPQPSVSCIKNFLTRPSHCFLLNKNKLAAK